MIKPIDVPVLSLRVNNIHVLESCSADNISCMWNGIVAKCPWYARSFILPEAVFSKCKDSLENGRRLENYSWRLWYRASKTESACRSSSDDDDHPSLSSFGDTWSASSSPLLSQQQTYFDFTTDTGDLPETTCGSSSDNEPKDDANAELTAYAASPRDQAAAPFRSVSDLHKKGEDEEPVCKRYPEDDDDEKTVYADEGVDVSYEYLPPLSSPIDNNDDDACQFPKQIPIVDPLHRVSLLSDMFQRERSYRPIRMFRTANQPVISSCLLKREKSCKYFGRLPPGRKVVPYGAVPELTENLQRCVDWERYQNSFIRLNINRRKRHQHTPSMNNNNNNSISPTHAWWRYNHPHVHKYPAILFLYMYISIPSCRYLYSFLYIISYIQIYSPAIS